MPRCFPASPTSLILALLLLAVASIASTSKSTNAATRYRRRTVKVAPGLRLSRILDRRGPNRIRVLSIDATSRMTIDTVLSNNALPGFEKTSSMARRRDAIAAINGDYALPWGRPPHVFAEDGDLKASPITWGRAFAISRDEQDVYIGHPSTRITFTDPPNRNWRVNDWNEGKLAIGEVAAFTPAAGKHLRPPERACSTRLYPVSPKRWGVLEEGIVRDYRVDAVRCGAPRMTRRRGLVLSARRGDERRAAQIKALQVDDVVPITWKLGWRGVLDVIGGNPTLVERGRITAPTCSTYFCRRHPRTGVGRTATGRILFVTVDGRRPRSKGMTPWQFARLFRHLGARWALNLDGGGSTTMVVRNRIVNRPSDARGERAVSSALVVLPRADRREPEPDPYTPGAPSTTARAPSSSSTASGPGPTHRSRADTRALVEAARRVMLDPASMGGMLDAARREVFGPRASRLPAGMDRIATRFRAQHRR